jgi:TPR repeat protein
LVLVFLPKGTIIYFMPNSSDTARASTLTPRAMREAAVAGDAEAQFALGLLFAAGPAPRNYEQALHWYQKAADQNHRLAQFNLGQMFAQGQGMPRSDSMALMWVRRAADGGDAGAQFNMGDRYARASMHGSEMDAAESRIESYKWFTLAAAQNYRDALLCADSATMKMTREEVMEGNRRVKAFAAG